MSKARACKTYTDSGTVGLRAGSGSAFTFFSSAYVDGLPMNLQRDSRATHRHTRLHGKP